MSFERGWKQRRDAARNRSERLKGNPAYREHMNEMRLREMAQEHLAIAQSRHGRLILEQEELARQLKYYQERAEEDGRILGPSHPVLLRAAAIIPEIAAAAEALKPAEAEFKRKMRESDQRMAEMHARHEADEARRARAEAAASAAAEAILTPTQTPTSTKTTKDKIK